MGMFIPVLSQFVSLKRIQEVTVSVWQRHDPEIGALRRRFSNESKPAAKQDFRPARILIHFSPNRDSQPGTMGCQG
jgi:hypothetical protein